MSTGNTCAPAVQAMRQTQASPQAMEAATEAVTSGPVWVTPSSVTPLSAQKTASAFLSRLTSAVPWGHSGGPDHRLLQQAQAPDGLGDGVPAAGRLRHSPLIRRRDAEIAILNTLVVIMLPPEIARTPPRTGTQRPDLTENTGAEIPRTGLPHTGHRATLRLSQAFAPGRPFPLSPLSQRWNSWAAMVSPRGR